MIDLSKSISKAEEFIRKGKFLEADKLLRQQIAKGATGEAISSAMNPALLEKLNKFARDKANESTD